MHEMLVRYQLNGDGNEVELEDRAIAIATKVQTLAMELLGEEVPFECRTFELNAEHPDFLISLSIMGDEKSKKAIGDQIQAEGLEIMRNDAFIDESVELRIIYVKGNHGSAFGLRIN